MWDKILCTYFNLPRDLWSDVPSWRRPFSWFYGEFLKYLGFFSFTEGDTLIGWYNPTQGGIWCPFSILIFVKCWFMMQCPNWMVEILDAFCFGLVIFNPLVTIGLWKHVLFRSLLGLKSRSSYLSFKLGFLLIRQAILPRHPRVRVSFCICPFCKTFTPLSSPKPMF